MSDRKLHFKRVSIGDFIPVPVHYEDQCNCSHENAFWIPYPIKPHPVCEVRFCPDCGEYLETKELNK